MHMFVCVCVNAGVHERVCLRLYAWLPLYVDACVWVSLQTRVSAYV